MHLDFYNFSTCEGTLALFNFSKKKPAVHFSPLQKKTGTKHEIIDWFNVFSVFRFNDLTVLFEDSVEEVYEKGKSLDTQT